MTQMQDWEIEAELVAVGLFSRRTLTRSTIAGIIGHGRSTGAIEPGASPVGQAAYVRGYLHGVAVRRGMQLA
jgi:hypothetical protein